jgi:hypothetical protein
METAVSIFMWMSIALLGVLDVMLQVRLSKIFSWYFPDFGADKAARLAFLLPHLPADKCASLQQLLDADPAARGISVEHKPYDWTINAAE